MTGDLTFTLQEFTKHRKFNRKGPLSIALVVNSSRRRNMGLPLTTPRSCGPKEAGKSSGLARARFRQSYIAMKLNVCWPPRAVAPAAEASAICANMSRC